MSDVLDALRAARVPAWSAPAPIAKFYSYKTVEEITGLCRQTIWRMTRESMFPKPVPLSRQRVGFPRDAVDAWVEDRSKPAAE